MQRDSFCHRRSALHTVIPTDPRVPTPPTSAAAALVLLEPRSKGRDLIKVALKELLMRGVFRLHRKQEKPWLGRARDVRRVEWMPVGRAHQSLDSATNALAREVYSAALTDARLERVVGALRAKYGHDYKRFRQDKVLADLQVQGLIQIAEKRLLGFAWLRRVELTAQGKQQGFALKQQIQQAQRLPPKASTDQVAPLLALLGPAVVLVPSLWPSLQPIDEALRIAHAADFTYSFDFRFEDFTALDSACANIDDSVDASDGGDGGGDGGGD